MELIVRPLPTLPSGSQSVEVVERKGRGHPDTLCDAIAERISVRLCRYYRERFGVVLHHNVDKVLLCGGSARAAFGAGELLEPIEIYLGGRATRVWGGEPIPIDELAIDGCREALRAHVPRVDVEGSGVKIVSRLRPGAADLTRLFDRGAGAPLANDTSCGAGFAPLTDLERVVLAVEECLNSAATKQAHPAIGEDVKVMGVRRDAGIELTIGCAFVAQFLHDLSEYMAAKSVALDLALGAARRVTGLEVAGSVNPADDPERGDVFLTVTGTSAEAGDDGEVGRGNRTCGLITPYRAMSLEAAAGKNPVSHVGKLYNLVAGRLAAAIVAADADVTDASCILLGQIGRPVADAYLVDVRLACPAGGPTVRTENLVRDLVRAELEGLGVLRDALIAEGVPLF